MLFQSIKNKILSTIFVTEQKKLEVKDLNILLLRISESIFISLSFYKILSFNS